MTQQWIRKTSLLLLRDSQALDLSELHFRFKTSQTELESPNNCSIRVFNLAPETVAQIRGEFSEVVLQAGYEGNYGIIFRGTIKQFGVGKESATTTYLDILAADGDLGYNFGVVNATLAPNAKPQEVVNTIIGAMDGLTPGHIAEQTGGILPRGKVLFGMGRDLLRMHTQTHNQSWSIQDGHIQILPTSGYLPNELVVLSALTGLVGTPEQTQDGLRARCLLNPSIIPGGQVQIDNKAINQLVQQDPNAAPIAYNQWTGLQLLATITTDGFYRVFVAEHEGDTRGQDWYTNLNCLAIDKASSLVVTRN